MHEQVTKPKTPIPTINYFELFGLQPTDSIDTLKGRSAALVRTLHSDNNGGRETASREEFVFATNALTAIRALAKDPLALKEYRESLLSDDSVRPAQEPLTRSRTLREGDFMLYGLHLRPVPSSGVIAQRHDLLKLVNQETGDVMGSRAFTNIKLVGNSLVGTYWAGLGEWQSLIDPETGEVFGKPFKKIISLHGQLVGETHGSVYRIDPASGSVSRGDVDMRV